MRGTNEKFVQAIDAAIRTACVPCWIPPEMPPRRSRWPRISSDESTAFASLARTFRDRESEEAPDWPRLLDALKNLRSVRLASPAQAETSEAEAEQSERAGFWHRYGRKVEGSGRVVCALRIVRVR